MPTVRRLKNLYWSTLKSKLESKKSNVDGLQEQIEELPRKKTGRPLLVTEELDTQIQEYIKDLRKRGLAINTSIVMDSGRGIIMNKVANLLFENGGGINLTKDWAKYLMKRMGYVKRKACSKAKIDVERFKEIKEVFLLDVKNVITMDEIPVELIINFDQTALNYVPATSWTMEKEGTKRVEVVAKDDKWQITAVFGGSMSGDFCRLSWFMRAKQIDVYHNTSFLHHGTSHTQTTTGLMNSP